MTQNDILEKLKHLEQNNYGEILDINEKLITYLDYSFDSTIEFRADEQLNDEYIKSIIHISQDICNSDTLKNYIINIIKTTFQTEYNNVIRTLSGIIIPSNKDEYNNMLNKCCRTSDDISEWYNYTDESDYSGHAYITHQIVFINHENILKTAQQLSDEQHSVKHEYNIGFLTTLIHELRHIQMECNPLLHTNTNLQSEEAVEEFALNAYESLPYELRNLPINIQ